MIKSYQVYCWTTIGDVTERLVYDYLFDSFSNAQSTAKKLSDMTKQSFSIGVLYSQNKPNEIK